MPERKTGAKVFANALEKYGVSHLFGNPGTTELPLIKEVKNSSIDYIMALHEDVAVGAAAGYANRKRHHERGKPSEMLGVVNLHTTPGLAHGLGNTYGAMFAEAPVLVTTGSLSQGHEKNDPPLSGERTKLAEPFTKWAYRVESADELADATRKAVKTAVTPPTGPVFLDIPVTVQEETTESDVQTLGAIPKPGPADRQRAEEAATKLLESADPVLVVGNRLSHAGEEAVANTERLAETVGARVHGEPLMSEVSVSTDHENWVSTLDNTTTGMAEDVDTDTIAFVGCSTEAPAFFTGKPVIEDSTTVIQVGGSAGDVSNVYPVDVPVVGRLSDAIGQILVAVERDGPTEPSGKGKTTPGVGTVLDVIGQLVGRSERSETGGTAKERIETIAEKRREALAAIEANAPETEGRLSQPELCRTVDDVVDNEVIVVEGITTGFMLRELVSIRHDQLQGLKSGGLGYGLPAAVGVAVAEESREETRDVVGFIGDGSFQYYPQALYTAARHVESALTILVPENDGYGILRDSEVMDDPESLSFVPELDLGATAQSYGIAASTVENDEVASRLSNALRADENWLLAVPVGSDIRE